MLRAWALTTTLSVFESVQAKSVKIKKSSEALGWSKKLFVRRFENDTFESVFFKSVEIECVVVSAHPLVFHIRAKFCYHQVKSRYNYIPTTCIST